MKQLLLLAIDYGRALHTALQFFGKDIIRYLAIDGASSLDEQLDLPVFYVWAFAYAGIIVFSKDGMRVGDSGPVVPTFPCRPPFPFRRKTPPRRSVRRLSRVDVERLPGP